ncbi:hypothetical protein MH215_23220 [Paenibacillus sp. ACRSA]|uniref:hypothetical protein n=1 Tax=Paenibacillus sp. ACRSA TaxID=2918211 RepID=UPI001EF72D6A|nr:hypothetical protein [Paenibacillus sp. ACRSA]MCG7379917.1 hypothetical protein [Paenibacillus sp. ACRSA]
MTLMTNQKKKQFHISDYKNLVREIIMEGSLFSLFKFQTETIRTLTTEDEAEYTQQRIVEFLNILKEVADDCLLCNKCNQTYKFRICTGLSYKEDNAIELTCEGCDDCYTHSEERSHFTYFNFEAWREVDNLRKRSRGFTISYRLSSSPERALLLINDNKEMCPEIWINGHRVFQAEEVKNYWNYSKELLKKWKKNEEIQAEFTRKKNITIYELDERKNG